LKKYNENLFNKLLNEIEFYESLGFHKIADDFTNQLMRYSAMFEDVAKDVGGSYWDGAQKMISIQRVMAMFRGIPECAQFVNVGAGGTPTMFQSESEFRNRMQNEWKQKNPGKPLDTNALREINEAVQTQNIIDGGRSIIDSDPEAYRKCLEGATAAGFGKEVEQFFGQTT
jgi:hypothetical protein